jgi:hypothetical protein
MNDTAVSISDKAQLDGLIKTFFNTFNNKNRKQVNLNSIRNICLIEIVIIKKSSSSQTVYSLDSFIKPRIKLLTDETLRDFQESETEEMTHIFGHIAQRQSTCQKSGYLNDCYFFETGVKLFQFIQTETGWKISSLVWEDDENPAARM